MRSGVSVAKTGMVRPVVAFAVSAALTLCPAADGILLAASPAAAAAAAVGSLSVSSDPDGAAVYVDGQFVGQTPLAVQRLSAGDHRVRVVKDGYLENGRIVNVAAGKTGTLQVKLTGTHATEPERQAGGGGVSSGGEGGSNKKWIYIGAAAGGGVLAAVLLANRNKAPSFSGTPTATPSTALAGVSTVNFSASASDPNGDSISYTWNFGDGATGTGATTTHVYTASGNFNVSVKADDGKGGSATSNTTVAVKSLTGTWTLNVTGAIPNLNASLTLTQSGASVTGAYADSFGPGTVTSGSVAAGRITITVNQAGFLPFTFNGTSVSADANTFSGTAANFFGDSQAPAFTATRR